MALDVKETLRVAIERELYKIDMAMHEVKERTDRIRSYLKQLAEYEEKK